MVFWLLKPVVVIALALSLMACGGQSEETSANTQSPSYVTNQGKSMPIGFDFSLLDHEGNYHQLSRYKDQNAIVLISHGLGCPIVRQSTPDLQALAKRYKKKNVQLLMINPFTQDKRADIAQELADYQLDIPVLIDDTQYVSHSLNISRTAEVLVIDPKQWQVVYRGPINDRLDYEIQKNQPENEYLADFLDDMLAGATPAAVEIPFKGCAVTYASAFSEPVKTYTDHIAGILEKRCLSCHREGGVAPWAMTDYNIVKAWSFMMHEAVKTERMPPWQADDPSRALANNIDLTVAEKRDLLLWLKNGSPRGEGEDPLVQASADMKSSAQSWALGEPDKIVRTEAHPIPATGTLPYQYVFIEFENEKDLYVKAVHLRPMNKRVVHHSFLFVVPPKAYRDNMDAPTNNDWKSGVFATFAPGIFGETNPENVVRFIPAGSKLKFEIHYTPTGKAETGGVEVGFYYTEPKVTDRHYRMEGIYNQWFRLPPNESGWPVKAEKTFERDITLYELMPHMHYRGKTMRYLLITPDGEQQEILSVPRFDFNWQRQYRLEKPILVKAGSTIKVDGSFDNSANNPYNPDPSATIGFGEQTSQEMFIGYITYTLAD